MLYSLKFAGKKGTGCIQFIFKYMSTSGQPNNSNRGTIFLILSLVNLLILNYCVPVLSRCLIFIFLNRKLFLSLFSTSKNQSAEHSSVEHCWSLKIHMALILQILAETETKALVQNKLEIVLPPHPKVAIMWQDSFPDSFGSCNTICCLPWL